MFLEIFHSTDSPIPMQAYLRRHQDPTLRQAYFDGYLYRLQSENVTILADVLEKNKIRITSPKWLYPQQFTVPPNIKAHV